MLLSRRTCKSHGRWKYQVPEKSCCWCNALCVCVFAISKSASTILCGFVTYNSVSQPRVVRRGISEFLAMKWRNEFERKIKIKHLTAHKGLNFMFQLFLLFFFKIEHIRCWNFTPIPIIEIILCRFNSINQHGIVHSVYHTEPPWEFPFVLTSLRHGCPWYGGLMQVGNFEGRIKEKKRKKRKKKGKKESNGHGIIRKWPENLFQRFHPNLLKLLFFLFFFSYLQEINSFGVLARVLRDLRSWRQHSPTKKKTTHLLRFSLFRFIRFLTIIQLLSPDFHCGFLTKEIRLKSSSISCSELESQEPVLYSFFCTIWSLEYRF